MKTIFRSGYTTCLLLLVAAAHLLSCPPAFGQTASTGALKGNIVDTMGAGIPGVRIVATPTSGGPGRESVSQPDGSFEVQLLPPGDYVLSVTKANFRTTTLKGLVVNVAETRPVSVTLTVGDVSESVDVTAQERTVDTVSSTIGAVVTQKEVVQLPLVTRNFTQILTLAAGVSSDVTNAGQFGRGIGGTAPTTPGGGTFAHGDRAYDNDFQINGLQVNDVMAQGNTSGGIPIPNPDTILEFKLATAQYDAAFGRRAGGDVSIVTKAGSNQFHGSAFEFFRNTVLNANSYFSKQNHQVRPVLNQNQYGFSLGGPVIPSKLTFFGSYQGTGQKNGVSSLVTVLMPAFTNDRSAAALGTLFAGRRGKFQGTSGPAILADGSNINPIALAILQSKLPNGTYVVPTPQTVNASLSPDSQGSSTYSTPSIFNENQYMGNTSYALSPSQQISENFFIATSNSNVALPGSNVPGYPNNSGNTFLVSSLEHSWILTPQVLNQVRVGFNRFITNTTQVSPYAFSSFGISAPATFDDLPNISIAGSDLIGAAAPGERVANLFLVDDSVAWSHGRHSFRFGGGGDRIQRNFEHQENPGDLTFESFPDLLLGLSAAQNGSSFSNVYTTFALNALFDRATRIWEANLYAQDDFKLTKTLTLNYGIRYDWLPGLNDALGRASNVDVSKLNPNPGSTPALAGIVVAQNFPGTVPAGVTQTPHSGIFNGTGQNSFGPRLGFTWEVLPGDHSTVLRGGYGIYYSRLIGQVLTQGTTTQPFGQLTSLSGTSNAAATLANPFVSSPPSFPTFTPYSSSTALSATAADASLRPGIIQQVSLGTQTQVAHNMIFELGTVETRGTHLLTTIGVNQAGIATATNPIRGITSDTVANASARVPYQGWSLTGLNEVQSSDTSWYSDLEATMTKTFANRSLLRAAYTWSKTLDGDGANTVQVAAASQAIGNQLLPRARYGPAAFSRPQRLVVSYVYELPFYRNAKGLKEKTLAGWQVSGVTTIQVGNPLTLTGTNSSNITGITNDRAQMASGCIAANLGKGGTVQSKTSAFFNQSCVGPSVAYTVIGSDGKATAFGNSGVGVVRGPAQNNYDISATKHVYTDMKFLSDIEFRAEFFNAFNTPQFANPNLNATQSSFGSITSTVVAPRIIQFALKTNF